MQHKEIECFCKICKTSVNILIGINDLPPDPDATPYVWCDNCEKLITTREHAIFDNNITEVDRITKIIEDIKIGFWIRCPLQDQQGIVQPVQLSDMAEKDIELTDLIESE